MKQIALSNLLWCVTFSKEGRNGISWKAHTKYEAYKTKKMTWFLFLLIHEFLLAKHFPVLRPRPDNSGSATEGSLSREEKKKY